MVQSNIITSAMDIMAGFELRTSSEKIDVLQTLIDSLANYPKPQKKGETTEPKRWVLVSYFLVSNIRNTSRLAILKAIPLDEAVKLINNFLMLALTELLPHTVVNNDLSKGCNIN